MIEAALHHGHGFGDLLKRAHAALLDAEDSLFHAATQRFELFGDIILTRLGILERRKPTLIGVDERGKISLSIKQAVPGGIPILPEDQRTVVEAAPPRRDRDDRGRGRSRRRD